ncbi:uncharacterized protein LOC144699997 [Wolffia australiana]
MEVAEHVHEQEEGEHHEKKSVLKKVKEKAKKIKETIGMKKHEHGEEEEGEERSSDQEETEQDAEVHGAPMYETEAAKGFVANQEKEPSKEGSKLEEDAGAPPTTAAAPLVPGSYQSTGSSHEVAPIEPGLIRSFQAMSTEEGQKKEEDKPSQEHAEMSYKDKITSTIVDTAVHAKEAAVTAYEKLTPQKKAEEEGEAGKKQADKWVTVKDYLAEKLSPGEEDKALCEVISETIHKRKEEEQDIQEEPAKQQTVEEKSSSQGVVGKIKGAVASVFGGYHPPMEKTEEGVSASKSEQERAPRIQESVN